MRPLYAKTLNSVSFLAFMLLAYPALAQGSVESVPLPTDVQTAVSVQPELEQPQARVTEAPIQSTALAEVDPDSIGVLTHATGNLGGGLWAGTPRAAVERELSALHLPTPFPTLNRLARKLLLSTTEAPVGKSLGIQLLSNLRIQQLLSLGDAPEADQLAHLSRSRALSPDTQLALGTSLLFQGDAKTQCDSASTYIRENVSIDWQKFLVLCQLRSTDTSAAQLSIDLLRDQVSKTGKQDIFIEIINRNLIGGSKVLPRRLTPLTPTILALLHKSELPLPTELFGKFDATLAPALIEAPTTDINAKLAFVEKAATYGLVMPDDLAALYRATQRDTTSHETPQRTRAFQFQEIENASDMPSRMSALQKFVDSMDGALSVGTTAQLLANAVQSIAPLPESSVYAALMTQVFTMAGRLENAQAWYKIAIENAKTTPTTAQRLQTLWPILAVSNVLPDSDYAQQLPTWVQNQLKDADTNRQLYIANVLLTLSAAGFAVPEDIWVQLDWTIANDKHIAQAPALLVERLHNASLTERKGEVILLSLLLADKGFTETPYFVFVDSVRALRLSELTEATAFARELLVNLKPAASLP